MRPIDLMPASFRPTYKHAVNGDGTVTVTVTPPSFIGQPAKSVTLSADQFDRYAEWRRGSPKLIQDLLSDLTVDQREILMNGGVEL